MKTMQMWVLLDKRGSIVPWVGARATRKQVMSDAALGCISATDYQRLATDSARWRITRRHGYRIAKATITLETP